MSDISLNEAEDRLPVLPQGWVQATISDLIGKSGVFIDGDWVESKDQDPQGDIRLIQLADIGDGTFRDKSNRFLTSAKAAELNCTFLKENDVLTARMPDPLGRACIFPHISQQCVTVVDVCIVRTGINSIDHHWLMYTINSPKFRLKIDALQSGSTRKRISRGNLSKLVLPIPPLPEQHRIVTKIEELFTQLDAGVALLKKVQAQLKRYRQAVLKAAFEGRLTQEWREEHKGKIESADVLIKKIAEDQFNLNKKKPLAIRLCGNDSLPLLPDRWSYATISHISEKIVDCPHSTPKYGVGDCLCVDTTCIDPMKLVIEKLRRVDCNTFDERNKRLVPQAGDIVFAREGTIGTAVVLPETPSVCLGQRVMLIRTSNRMNPKYVCYSIMSPQIQNSYKSKILGSTVAHINVGDVINFKIPISSRSEQDLIVSEIERHFSQIDHLEHTITTSLRQAESLRQSILKRAFEGKLVPQDPNDEPASVLLERIKAEKARHATETKKGKTLQPKSPKRKIKNGN